MRGGKYYGAIPIPDPYFNLVTLLLPGNGANGAQNNTFLDASTNNFAITRNGNTTQGTFSPFSLSGWSNYFDGSGDYLALAANSAFLFTGDFTIEAWVNLPAVTGGPYTIFGSDYSASVTVFDFRVFNSNIQVSLNAGSGTNLGLGTLSTNRWAHMALVRSGSSIKCYVDGTQTATTLTNSSTLGFSDVAMAVGSSGPPGTNPFNGYISNLRILNGTALYTSNFTPPSSNLAAIANTSLLTCQSNRFIDNSSNNFALTVNGQTRVIPFSPFQPDAPYSTGTNGGSLYLRGPVSGATDYLSIASDPAFQFGNSNFTVETWLYPTAVNTVAIYSKRANTSTAYGSIVFNIQSDRTVRVLGTVNGSSWGVNSQSNTLINANCWNHVAVTRNGTLWNIWVNGINSANSVLAGTIPDNPANVTVGTQGNNQSINNTPVYFSDLRVVKGTAVYTTNFTLPTSPLTAISNTSLLLNSTNAGIRDAAADNVIETIGNVQISTVQSKFGGSSISFDGSGDYFIISSTTADPLLAFGTGDFTIEFWIRFNTTAGVTILDYRPGSNGAYATIITDATNKIIYYSNSANRILGTTALVTNSWHHIAVVRSSGSTKLYINGINEGSAFADTQNYLSGANRPVVGTSGFPLGTGSLNAYIQDLRITRNLARYTANFTPPTQAFPTQ